MSDAIHEIKEAVVIKPGDTLILRVDATGNKALTRQQAETIRERCMELLPELDDVLVIQCDGVAVYRPGEDSDE
jgi:hypothetical protein